MLKNLNPNASPLNARYVGGASSHRKPGDDIGANNVSLNLLSVGIHLNLFFFLEFISCAISTLKMTWYNMRKAILF